MAATLSFKDINITFKKHPITDDLVVSKDASAIKQAIVNLLLTNKGERVFNPNYGSDIRRYLFEPLDYGSAALIKQEISQCISRYEPRIRVQKIYCNVDFDNNGYNVEMQYKIVGRDDRPVAVDFFLERTR